MFEEIACWENLHVAYRKAAKGKRSRAEVAGFEYRLEDNLVELRRELLEGSHFYFVRLNSAITAGIYYNICPTINP